MKRLFPLLVLAALACSDVTPPPPPDPITGDWVLTLSVGGSGGSCSITAGSMTLTRSGSSFSGRYGPSPMICNGASQGNTQGSIVNGTLSGSSVAWDMDDASVHQTGTLNGSTMSGGSVWTISSNGTQVVLRGSWSATKR